jgi:hypothetical protein
MNTFTTREDWLAQAIAELRPVYSALNHPLLSAQFHSGCLRLSQQ